MLRSKIVLLVISLVIVSSIVYATEFELGRFYGQQVFRAEVLKGSCYNSTVSLTPSFAFLTTGDTGTQPISGNHDFRWVLWGTQDCTGTPIYNESYDKGITDGFLNATMRSLDIIVNAINLNMTFINQSISNYGLDIGFNNTFNSSYDNFAYNQTVPSNTYTDLQITNTNTTITWLQLMPPEGNFTLLNIANITGFFFNYNQTGLGDTNASTICSDGEYLDGNGACINFNSTVSNFGLLAGFNDTFNIFDQDLNTTSDVVFNNITAMNISANFINVSNLDVSGDLNVSNNIYVGNDIKLVVDGVISFKNAAIFAVAGDLILSTISNRISFQMADPSLFQLWFETETNPSMAAFRPQLGGFNPITLGTIAEPFQALYIRDNITIAGNIFSDGNISMRGNLEIEQGNITINDSFGLLFGNAIGGDASILYDGFDFLFNPNIVGSGRMIVDGDLVAQTINLTATRNQIFFSSSAGGGTILRSGSPAGLVDLLLPSSTGTLAALQIQQVWTAPQAFTATPNSMQIAECISHTGDGNSLFCFSNLDELEITLGGEVFATWTENGASLFNFNPNQEDIDSQIESSGNPRMFFIDGGNNRVGIGTAPSFTLDVDGDARISVEVNITTVSEDCSGKVVCIKSDGNLGTCSSGVSLGGSCTCG